MEDDRHVGNSSDNSSEFYKHNNPLVIHRMITADNVCRDLY